MEIEFNWNGSFVGSNYSMVVDGRVISLLGFSPREEDVREEAVRILKEEYDINYTDDISFTWGEKL